MRDAHGRFVNKRSHLYRLVYDGGGHEDVLALTPSAAIANRKGGRGSLLPHTMTDLTRLHDAWLRGDVPRRGVHLLVRIEEAKTKVIVAAPSVEWTPDWEDWDD